MPSMSIASCAQLSRTALLHDPRPDELSSIKPLLEKTHPIAIPKEDLQHRGVLAAERKEMSREGIFLQSLLYERCKSMQALPHAGVAESQVHFNARRQRSGERSTIHCESGVDIMMIVPAGANTRRPSANSTAIAPG